MKFEEAIVYLLATSGHWMRTEQFAREINARGLYTLGDKTQVTKKGLCRNHILSRHFRQSRRPNSVEDLSR